MRYQLLGPLAAFGDDGPIAIGGLKQRVVLAHLLLRVNQTVPADHLIDAVWGDEPPVAARGTLQAYVSRLRGRLGTERIEGHPPGYRFRADPEDLDSFRFEELLKEARDDGHEPKTALDVLDEALDLWRGPALADLALEPSLTGEIARLEELRLVATEERIAARLDLGHHAEVVAELEAATATYPMRERLWGQLVLALYRSGRQAEALAAFDRARELLREELGIDPSHELRDIHERVLRQDEALQLPGEPLRGYRLLEKLGEGAFGAVYRAIQPHVQREVAVKSIHAELANQPDFVRRFEREAQIIARLEHPHIVPLYDYWREPDAAYLIMRFLRGGNLEDLIGARPLELEPAAKILDHVAAALSAAHHQGVVHRDVKPGNVLLDDDGNAYLSDFGIALETGAPEQTAGTMIRGTPAYLSPEQIKLEQTTPRSDIYALGVVLYEMLTGEHPFPGTSLNVLLDQHLHHPIPSVRTTRPEIAPSVDAAIGRATAKDPQARFGDALELCAAFHDAIGSKAPVTVRGELRNPYKGLRAFLEADSADFFGRELLTRRLVERLAENGTARFLCLVGPSGSGKSSVTRAGLVPAIRRGVIAGSERWFVVDLVPGAHPLRELETALLGVSVDPPPSLLEELELDELGLTRAVNRLLPDPDAELLIVIDQLEELFTLVDSDAERAHVLESIRVATADPTSRIRVVATLRADFYDQPLSVRGFGDLLAARNEAITPMSPEELERAIVGPAERVGLDVEPGLVAAMVADVIDRPGALPLLQYALTELADREDIGALTLSAYRKIGGVSGALARRAEHLYDALDEAERVACRQLFLRLVTLGEGTEDTRRRVRRSDLLPIVDRRAIDGVIETYGRHRLISFDREPGSREPTVEIAHEALLAAWARLHGWIDEARDDLRSLNRLAASSGEWMSSGRDPSFLLGGSRLEQTAEWAASTTISMSAADRAFLDESVRQREHDRAGEAERVARERGLERRSVRRLRGLVAVFAAAALVAASLTVVARNQGDRAEDALRVASARELAGAAVANLEADPERSLLLALAAVETTRAIDGTVLREAEEALHRAIGASRVVTRLNVEAADVEFSPDGARLATTGNPDEVFGSAESKTERHAFVWDTETGDREVVLSGHREGVWEVHFSPDGSRLATASEDGTAAIWDGDTGERMFVLRGHAHGQLLASFSADGSKLLTTDLAGAVRLWDARTGKLEREFSNSGICGGGLSPDGSLVAGEACEELGTGLVVDAHTGERILKLKGHTSPLLDMAFSPDGSLIATGSVDGSARIWAAGTGRKLLTLEGHGGWVFGVDFDPAGEVVATAGEDGTARLWDATSGRELLVLSGHTGIIRDVDFSPDGRRLATSSGDGTVRVWDVGPQGSREQATLAGPDVTPSVAYSPDGRWIATASYDGRARLWNAATGRRIVTFSGGDASSDVALAPDGKTLATAGFSVSGTPILWDTASGKIQRILGGPKGWTGSVAFSPDGTRIATGLGGTDEGSGQVLLWEMATGRLIDSFGELKPGDHPIVDLAFSRDGKLLAAASFDGTARVWILASGEESLTLRPHAIVVGVAFNPDGQLLATSGTDGTVKIWNVSTGAEVRSLAGHLGTVARVAFSPDGKLLASAGFDNTARLWDVSTGRQLLVLTGHTLGLTDLAFSPDGTRLATSANDGTVRVYVLPIEELIELARSRLTRSWTEDECRQYLHLSACPTT